MISHDRQIYEWDTNNKNHNEKFKLIFQEAKFKENRKIFSPIDGKTPLSCFREVLEAKGFVIGETELKEGQFALHFINESGDIRLIWDSQSKKEVKEAKEKFEEYIQRGWRAYAINRDGSKSKRRIYGFDDNLEEIYVDESKTIKEKFGDFLKTFREIQVQPKTIPG